MSIVLTGATGGLGSQVLKHLSTLVPPTSIVVSLRDPSRPDITSAFPQGVQVREGDFTRPDTLAAAFAGASTLLLVSYPSIAHEIRVRAHVNAIDAARRAGVQHVYYTSLAFADGSGAAVMRAHFDTEAYLKRSGIAYTIVREGIYAESYPLYLGFFDPSNGESEVYVPGDGPVAWASREDLGEATARMIAQRAFVNQTVLLSGPSKNALTLAQLADILSHILKRKIAVRLVSVDEYVEKHTNPEAGIRGEPSFLREWATTFPAMANGDTGHVDPLLEELLGRPARAMEDHLRASLVAEGEGDAYVPPSSLTGNREPEVKFPLTSAGVTRAYLAHDGQSLAE